MEKQSFGSNLRMTGSGFDRKEPNQSGKMHLYIFVIQVRFFFFIQYWILKNHRKITSVAKNFESGFECWDLHSSLSLKTGFRSGSTGFGSLSNLYRLGSEPLMETHKLQSVKRNSGYESLDAGALFLCGLFIPQIHVKQII